MPPNDSCCSRKICISGWLPLLGSNHVESLQVSFFRNFIFGLAGDNNIQWADPTSDNYYQNWSCSFTGKSFLLQFLPKTTGQHGCVSAGTEVIAKKFKLKTEEVILCKDLSFFLVVNYSVIMLRLYFYLHSLWWLISCNPHYPDCKLQFLVASGHKSCCTVYFHC